MARQPTIVAAYAPSNAADSLSTGQVNGGGSTQDGAVHLDVKSGGRTAVKDAKTNKRIQGMGMYCVAEYNKGLKQKNLEAVELLKFKEVVKAEKQVVAGVKYFLHIAATTHHGTVKNFDAEVLVKPISRDMEMLVFAPDMVS
nr:cysteine proteinase inhibitor B [Ipomoea trifida]